jgi:hypothetical protein
MPAKRQVSVCTCEEGFADETIDGTKAWTTAPFHEERNIIASTVIIFPVPCIVAIADMRFVTELRKSNSDVEEKTSLGWLMGVACRVNLSSSIILGVLEYLFALPVRYSARSNMMKHVYSTCTRYKRESTFTRKKALARGKTLNGKRNEWR